MGIFFCDKTPNTVYFCSAICFSVGVPNHQSVVQMNTQDKFHETLRKV